MNFDAIHSIAVKAPLVPDDELSLTPTRPDNKDMVEGEPGQE